MKLQYLCHLPAVVLLLGIVTPCAAATAVANDTPAPAHAYPTVARVEYVNECIGKSGGQLAALYQCSCVIDRIANAMTYDEFVDASTFAKYATLPGAGGGIFRDSDESKKLAKSFRSLEADAMRSCGVTHAP